MTHAAPANQHKSSLRIMVTAGPTREFFDTVRFISNSSSGKQGYAIAAAAVQRGHQVVLVSGPVGLDAPDGVKVISVTSAAEMAEVCRAEFESCDAAVFTAAVCDYRPPHKLPHKLKKSDEQRTITLEPTEDISATLGKDKGPRLTVCFSMDDRDGRRNAEAKLARKNADAVVLNGPGNIATNDANVQIFTPGRGWQDPISGSKSDIAHVVLELVEQLASTDRSVGAPQ